MYVCTYVSYVRTYVCMYACMYVCIYLCMYVRTYVCMYVCMYVSIYIYVCMYVRTYVRMYVCVYVCIYVFPYDTVINWPTTSADFHKSVVGVHGLNLPAQVVSFHLHQPLCTSRVALFICSELGEGSKYWNSSMVVLQVLCGSDWFH